MVGTDTFLLERWRSANDPDAFAELVARHAPMVYGSSMRILDNAASSDEVCQECFIELLKSTVQIRSSLAGWLHTMATHRSLDRLKAERRRKEREVRYMEQQTQHIESTWDDISAYIDESIEALPEALRLPIILRFFEGKTYQAIAEEHEIARSTVQSRIGEGIVVIREHLARKGIAVSAATFSTMLAAAPSHAVPVAVTTQIGKLALAGNGSTAATTVTASAMSIAAVGGIVAMKKTIVAGAVLLALFLSAMYVTRDDSTERPAPGSTERIASEPAADTSVTVTPINVPDSAEPVPPAPIDEPTVEKPASQEEAEPAPPPDEPPSGARIQGYVLDLDGRGIAKAEILVGLSSGDSEAQTQTDEDGSFELAELDETSYLVGARHPEYAPTFVRTEASTGATEPIEIILGRGGVLEGQVTLVGQPLPECRVGIFHLADGTSGQLDVRTDSKGHFRAKGLAVGSHQVQLVTKPSRTTSSPRIIGINVVIVEGQTTRADFDFPATSSVIEGFITFDGVPPTKATIALTLTNENNDIEFQSTQSDTDGYYRFDELPPGKVQLRVDAESSNGTPVDVTRKFSVAENELIEADIELLSGGTISGVFSGLPEGFEVGVFVLSGNLEVGEITIEDVFHFYETAVVVVDMMKDNEFHATGLEPGTYTVLLLAIKQTVSDAFGNIIAGNYLVQLEEGEEVFLEHSFE